MSTTRTTETGIDPDVMADLEAVCNTWGTARSVTPSCCGGSLSGPTGSGKKC